MLRVVGTMVAIVVLGCLVNIFGMGVYTVSSESMAPTIEPGWQVIVDRASYYVRQPVRGEVVVFDGSGVFTDPRPGEHTFVKRVIGVGGDRVACCDVEGRVQVNGVSLSERGHLAPGSPASEVSFDVVVPPGALWLMGDNRIDSADSRSYMGKPGGGFVPIDRVEGRVMATIGSITDFRAVELPDAFRQPQLAPDGGEM